MGAEDDCERNADKGERQIKPEREGATSETQSETGEKWRDDEGL